MVVLNQIDWAKVIKMSNILVLILVVFGFCIVFFSGFFVWHWIRDKRSEIQDRTLQKKLADGTWVICARCEEPVYASQTKEGFVDGMPYQDRVCIDECRKRTCLTCKKEKPITKMIALGPYDPSFSDQDYVCDQVKCAVCFYCGYAFDFHKIKLRTPPPELKYDSAQARLHSAIMCDDDCEATRQKAREGLWAHKVAYGAEFNTKQLETLQGNLARYDKSVALEKEEIAVAIDPTKKKTKPRIWADLLISIFLWAFYLLT